LKDLFLINGIDIDKLKNEKNIWFDIEEEIMVYDINGGEHKINKLYWNGYSKTKKIKLGNNESVESSTEHKWLVRVSETEAKWVRADELKISDKIIKIN